MFFSILLWDIIFLIQCFISFPKDFFVSISILCICMLIFTILFGNSFIYAHYSEKEELYIRFNKPTKKLLIKNILFGIPILLSLITFASVPFYIYGLIQFIFMYYDKEHLTMSERLYKTIKIKYEERKQKKESLLA